jgi:hypothetical protein
LPDNNSLPFNQKESTGQPDLPKLPLVGQRDVQDATDIPQQELDIDVQEEPSEDILDIPVQTNDPDVVWEQVELNQVENVWRQAYQEMLARIRRRRSGEEISDE